eukprot:jgi/Chlat1/6164/Chrsp41S05711
MKRRREDGGVVTASSAPPEQFNDGEQPSPSSSTDCKPPASSQDVKPEALDMFADDIFAETPPGKKRTVAPEQSLVDPTAGFADNWDDPEGYYCFRVGEVINGRYEVFATHGRGVFSTVLRARDLRTTTEVAIKIIRHNEIMYKAGQTELVILNKLAGADPDNKKHCIRLLTHFEYRNHLCMVFEPMHMNLREVLKKFGRNIGININAVRSYSQQMLIALKHMKNCGVLHADIKPDNILVNENKTVLKMCDFGSAMFAGDNDITPYLVSRFYRAPEIVLGLPYDHAMDMWSVGCCIFELYTGKMAFPGRTNNEMLKLHMDLKGPFPKKLLRKAAFRDQHFETDLSFALLEEDPVTSKVVKRIINYQKPVKDVSAVLAAVGSADEDRKLQLALRDLLEKMFVLDPGKRITVSQALQHPFISGKFL